MYNNKTMKFKFFKFIFFFHLMCLTASDTNKYNFFPNLPIVSHVYLICYTFQDPMPYSTREFKND